MQQMLLGLGAADYVVKHSLRFNDDDTAYLSRTPSSAGNRKKWTFSAWIKRGTLGGSAGEQRIFGGNANASHIYFPSNDEITWDLANEGSGSSLGNLNTTQKFRDPSAWFHLVCALDTDESTADNRMRMYINGTEVTSFGSRTNPSSGYATNAMNNNTLHTLGYRTSGQGSAGMEFDGHIAEIHFIDGEQYNASSFGKTDTDTGQWNPKKYTGSYGTNGFYLKFADNSNTTAGTLGKDSSGNTNNWTPSNFVTGDSLKDTPNNNFVTLQMMGTPYESGASLSEGNLKLTSGSTNSARNLNRSAFAPFLVNSGKWYAEFMQKDSTSSGFIGVGPYQQLSPTVNNTRYAYVRRNDGNAVYRTAGSETIATYGSSISQYDIIGVYLNMDAGTPVVYFSKNGQWADGSGNFDESSPTSGITLGDSFFTTDTGGWDGYGTFICSSSDGGTSVQIQANFGQDSTFSGQTTAGGNSDANGEGDFKYAVPTGAKSMCTANLADPTIPLPNKHFDTLTWSGNSTKDTDITGLDFQPDWVWIKSTSHSVYSGNLKYNHVVWDAIRGVGLDTSASSSRKELTINEIYPEGSAINLSNYYGHVNAFNSDGFTLDHITGQPAFLTNQTGRDYVAWNWNAGGTTVTNNNGTISSQVRANTTAGFSIITYTGTGSAGATVGHGLGVTPDVIIIKNRTDGSSSFWGVYHKAAFNNASDPNILYLNTNQAEADDTNVFGTSVTIDSNKFSLGDYNGSNGSGDNMVAYCFSEVAGYSKFGSYNSNNNTDGSFIFLGFKPAWFLVKDLTSATDWVLWDNKRNPFNPTGSILQPSRSDANYSTGVDIDFVSNGVKLRGDSGYFNNPANKEYAYLAFAESPFKYSRAQ